MFPFVLFPFDANNLFETLAIICLAVCDKLIEHGESFSSINWPGIALLLCLNATQFYWKKLFEIFQIHRLLSSKVYAIFIIATLFLNR